MADKIFLEKTQPFGLSSRESELLFAIARNAQVEPPETIVESIALFEKAVHAEIESIKRQYAKDLLDNPSGLALYAIRKKLGFDKNPPQSPLLSSRMIELGQECALHEKDKPAPLIGKVIVSFRSEIIVRISFNAALMPKERRIVQGEVMHLVLPRKDGLYSFAVTAFSVSNSSIDFFHTMEFTRRQIRQYVRIPIDSMIRVVSDRPVQVTAGGKKMQSFLGRMVDISGGGICFMAPELIEKGGLVFIEFRLGSIEFRGIKATIVNSYKASDLPPNMPYRYHIQFFAIDTNTREKIIKFIFEQQRLLASKDNSI